MTYWKLLGKEVMGLFWELFIFPQADRSTSTLRILFLLSLQVAIKRLSREYSNWKECSTLAEVESLKYLSHPSIVKLFGIVTSNNQLHLVFEHMKSNLYELIKQKSESHTQFPEPQIRNIMWVLVFLVPSLRYLRFQVLSGLLHIHQTGYIHRGTWIEIWRMVVTFRNRPETREYIGHPVHCQDCRFWSVCSIW